MVATPRDRTGLTLLGLQIMLPSRQMSRSGTSESSSGQADTDRATLRSSRPQLPAVLNRFARPQPLRIALTAQVPKRW